MENEMSTLEKYLLIINSIGFFGYALHFLVYKLTHFIHLNKVLTLLALAGGSLGIVDFMVLFDRKSVKDNMMSRVLIVCALIIQIIIVLFMKGFHREELNFAFWTFFGEHKTLMVYLGIINLITFVAFAIDKIHAVQGKSRIRILTLLGLAFIGGSVGALVGMYLLRHKTRVNYFTVGIPVIMLMQVAVVFMMMNFRLVCL